MTLPDWIDREAWDGFCDMREVMHKETKGKVPWTDRAQKIALSTLDKFHEQGYDCNYILDEAVLHGWRGLFVNERTPKQLRDKHGNKYRITAEGFREFIQ